MTIPFPLPLPSELIGELGPLLLFIDWIGENVFAPVVVGIGDVLLWLFKLLWLMLLLLLLLLFMLLLLLLQFNSEISGLRSGGDSGPTCPMNDDESMPEKGIVRRNKLILNSNFQLRKE